MKLIYLSLARLPTEKAHGLQICKMCEALGDLGVDLSLIHPYRAQSDPALASSDLYAYYGIRPSFKVKTLPRFDILPCLESYLPAWMVSIVWFISNFFWTLRTLVGMRALRHSHTFYTRDPIVAFWLSWLHFRFALELHTFRPGFQSWLISTIKRAPNLIYTSVLTQALKERLVLAGFAAKNVVVQPDAVDLKLFEALPDTKTARAKLDLPVDAFLIGYVGRFVTMQLDKGVPNLIRALVDLPPQVKLLCVGGPLSVVPGFESLAHELGISPERLIFRDRVPNTDVPLWLSACDVLTIPWDFNQHSAYFTSPLKLFEYMAAERPIIASDLPALREILVDQNNALLVPPGDSTSIALATKRLMQDTALANQIAARAKRDVQAHSWASRAEVALRHLSLGDKAQHDSTPPLPQAAYK